MLVGFGSVGRSFTSLLSQRKESLAKEFRLKPKVVAVVDRGGAAMNHGGLDLDEVLKVKADRGSVSKYPSHGTVGTSPLRVLDEVEAEVLVETTSTNIRTGEPGISHIRMALSKGLQVITANKGPVALALPMLQELADYNGCHLRFSGTVGGGIPLLRFAKECLLGDRVISIRGILNGTTNFILTEMEKKGLQFEEALQKAQEAGVAEADPSLDVDGFDTAAKLVILANWVMEKKITLQDVDIKGIRGITVEDARRASEKESSMKLVGSIDDGLKVRPIEVNNRHPLCVHGTLNAVTFTSQYAGELTLTGKGAGGMETASAVLRDLLDISGRLAE